MPDYSGFLTNFSGSQNTSTDLMSHVTTDFLSLAGETPHETGFMYIGNLLLQFTTGDWNNWPATTNNGSNGSIDVYFPIAFSSYPFSVQLTSTRNDSTITISDVATNKFKVTSGQHETSFTWLAIGPA